MTNIEQKNLLVWLKAMSRPNPLPLDESSVWETKEAAVEYAKKANAYAGQVLTALDGGKYKTFVLQPGEAGYTLEEVGAVQPSDLKQYVFVVSQLPTEGIVEGALYINTTDKTGQVWESGKWTVVFKEMTDVTNTMQSDITDLQNDMDTKAPINNPTFTGTVTLAADPTQNLQAVTKQYVDRLIDGLVDSTPGIVGDSNPLPVTGYKAGQTWRVATAGVYAGQTCENGDLIICLKDYAEGTASDADFMVVQANINGAVTSTSDATTAGNIVVFDGITGKIIKDSTVNISSLNDAISKAHVHANKVVLDTYDKNQQDLLAAAKAEANGLVEALKTTVDGKADKATTLAGYGITDAYTQTEIDNKLKPITDNLNSKADATQVVQDIETAKTDAVNDSKTYTDTKIGVIPDGSENVVAYVDRVVGSGGADIANQINQAKTEAIAAAKAYTDQQVKVIEF